MKGLIVETSGEGVGVGDEALVIEGKETYRGRIAKIDGTSITVELGEEVVQPGPRGAVLAPQFKADEARVCPCCGSVYDPPQ